MRLRHKLLLLAAVPSCLALVAVALAVQHQAIALAKRHQATLSAAYLVSTRIELKRHVELALHTVSHLYETGRTDAAIRHQARQMLATLEAGAGGYFFVYDHAGRDILHAGDAGDDSDRATPSVPLFIDRADKGGGYVRFSGQQLGQPDQAVRLAYVSSLPRWGWVVGSGIALDDIDTALAGLSDDLAAHLRQAMLLLAAVALAAALAASLPSLLAYPGLWRREPAGTRLRPRRAASATNGNGTSLRGAMAQLCAQWRATSGDGMRLRLSQEGELDAIPERSCRLLLNVAQEALNNIARHAHATEVSLRLHGGDSLVMLQVRDNGMGSMGSMGGMGGGRPHAPHGDSLHGMRAQLEANGGALALDTSAAGTLLSAVVVRHAAPGAVPSATAVIGALGG